MHGHSYGMSVGSKNYHKSQGQAIALDGRAEKPRVSRNPWLPHTLFSGRRRNCHRVGFLGQRQGPFLPCFPTPILTFAECVVGSSGNVQHVQASHVIPVSSFQLLAKRVWPERGRLPSQNHSTGNAPTNETKLAVKETHTSHSVRKDRHCSDIPLSPASLLLWESRDWPDWLVWKRNGVSLTRTLSVFLFILPAGRKQPSLLLPAVGVYSLDSLGPGGQVCPVLGRSLREPLVVTHVSLSLQQLYRVQDHFRSPLPDSVVYSFLGLVPEEGRGALYMGPTLAMGRELHIDGTGQQARAKAPTTEQLTG